MDKQFVCIKEDIISLDSIATIGFNQKECGIYIYFKNGMRVVYGKELVPQVVPPNRIISSEQYYKIWDYFRIDVKTDIVVD